ncbi:putative phosphoenolpyruvate synthase [Uloborus diversus]|uniref:putative phosphoenolpyruvate synthase n=1 Tax=Uloborus diversus TaxID=327109 RepID=UPI00240947AC|nr:putative phosphoenolpyruvate synthase [Uloborus diversus]
MILSTLFSILSASTDVIFWLKWIVIRILLRIYQSLRHRRFDLYDCSAVNDPLKLGFLYPKLEKQVESPHPEFHLENAADEIFFYGVNSSGECLIVRIARGCGGEAEAWIYIKLKDGRTYHLTETQGYEQEGERTFVCGGLRMHFLAPMRRWRIFYSGMLNETTNDESDPGVEVFVKFAFMWKASSNIYDAASDMSPSTVAESMARAKWKTFFLPPVKQIAETLDTYCQTGVIHGIISTEEHLDYEMYLFGEKNRFLGNTSNTSGCEFKQFLGNIPQNGLSIHLSEMSIPSMFKNLKFGFVVEPSGSLNVLTELNALPDTCDSSETNFNASFKASKHYELEGRLVGEVIQLHSKKGWKGYVEVRHVDFTVQEYKGTGFLLTGKMQTEARRTKSKDCLKFPEKVPLTVKFTEKISQFTEISGGKGASLGKLTELSGMEKTFIVPKGITVTTAAYSSFLTQDILEQIKDLEDVVYGKVDGDAETACKRVSSAVMEAILPRHICSDIIKNLSELFNQRIENLKFAVRSSATGEDTEQMSAAGQMDTFLGVQGLQEIFTSVKKCWASQFGYIAVEYKRRNGQVLNSPMAVVIQEMVPCDVSGVLFTCDPVTNNPSVITITGNYGLGESVVSGSEEPDTITLQKEENGEVSLKSVAIGAKKHKIVMEDDGGVGTEVVPENVRQSCCISQEMANFLGKVSVKIEKYYHSLRDIEWGIQNDVLYILQSRPVTSGTAESDFEIKHEFDAPLRCVRDYTTLANVGEVMPGAFSPLGIDVLYKYFGSIFRKDVKERGKVNNFHQSFYFASGLVSFYNRMMLSVVELISRMDGHESLMAQASMIAFFGRILDDEDIFKLAREKAPAARESAPSHWDMIRKLFFAMWEAKKVKKHLESFEFPVQKYKSSQEMFHALMNSCSEYDGGFNLHISCTEGSMAWNIFLFLILGKNKEHFDTEAYSDFSRLLSSASNVVSADVPGAMQDVACSIVQHMTREDFKAMNIEDATNWLQTSPTTAGVKFREFLQTYGHRCLKEFDVHTTTWGLDPKSLVKLLQNMSGSCEKNDKKASLSYSKLFSELNTPLDFKSRFFLRLLLPNCRRAVGEREFGKSMLIKSLDVWRRAFITLSKLMFSEGRIPDRNLLFFLTINEIHELLQTRSPTLIAKAIHRRKFFPTFEKYIFPEMMKGLPKPINEETDVKYDYDSSADLKMKGIPVSQGVIRGFARVAVTLEEAAHLKQGEILITYSTDIGWSPYFPILSGVVTELGGLISHGAVISREYGLPCVVGLQGATRQFQTGDFVLLDGNKGILQRIPKPETE